MVTIPPFDSKELHVGKNNDFFFGLCFKVKKEEEIVQPTRISFLHSYTQRTKQKL